MRPFHVNLNHGFRAERTHDDVGRHADQLLRGLVLPAGQFPDQTVVESELLDFAVANAITATVADVANPGAFGANDECRAGRAHAGEFAVLLPARVNDKIRLDEGFAQGLHGPFVGMLRINVRYAVGGDLAG